MRPDEDIPEDVWEKAGEEAMKYVEWLAPKPFEYSQSEHVLAVSIARAILAERDRCAKIADAYAEVNWESCTDSILLDPVLSNRGTRALTKDDFAKSEAMAIDGTIHSSMYHAAQNIAAAIRGPHAPE